MAKIYQAGGGGRKRRGFKGTKVPESTAIEQQTKITLQGMQRVKDEIRSQQDQISRSRSIQQNIQEGILSGNVRQARENVRIIENANLRDYKTKVLSLEADKARKSFEQKQQEELMQLIPKAVETVGQIDQLRRKSAATFVKSKTASLGFLSQAQQDEYFSKISQLKRGERLSWWAQQEGVDPETQNAYEGIRKGYRAIIRQSNTLSDRLKDPTYIKGVEGKVDAQLQALGKKKELAKINEAKNRLATSDPRFDSDDKEALIRYNSYLQKAAFDGLVGAYQTDFIAHSGRGLIIDHFNLERSDINAHFQDSAGSKEKDVFTDKFVYDLKANIGDTLKDTQLEINPSTKKPFSSGLEALILPGNTADNMKWTMDILDKASRTGYIVHAGGKSRMKFGQTELDAIGKQLVHGGRERFDSAFDKRFAQFQKNINAKWQQDQNKRDVQGFTLGADIAKKITDRRKQGIPVDDVYVAGLYQQAKQTMGGISSDEEQKWFEPARSAYVFGGDPPPLAGEILRQSLRGISPERADKLGIATTVSQGKMLRGLADIHFDKEWQEKITGLLDQIQAWGNNPNERNKDGYLPNNSSVAVRKKSEHKLFSRIRELLLKKDNELTGIQALEVAFGELDKEFKKGEGLFSLKQKDGKVIEHSGRGYNWPPDVVKVDQQLDALEAKFIADKNLLFKDGSLDDALVDATVRSAKFGDRIPQALRTLKRLYPRLSMPQLQATIIHHHARETGLTDDSGNMIMPGYHGFIQAGMPSVESERTFFDGTPSAGLADQEQIKNLSNRYNVSKKDLKPVLAESQMNPEVGSKYSESEQRWDAINIGDGWTLATESLGKSLYETPIREVMQFPAFETSLGVNNDDLMHSIKEGTINLDSVIDVETHEQIFTDKKANESNKFYIEGSHSDRPLLGDRYKRALYKSSPFYKPSLLGDIKFEWEQDLKFYGELLKGIGAGSKIVKDPFNLKSPSKWKAAYTSLERNLEEQSKLWDEEIKAQKASTKIKNENLKKALKNMMQYIITPPEQERMEALGNELANYDMNVNYFDKAVLTQLVNVLEAK